MLDGDDHRNSTAPGRLAEAPYLEIIIVATAFSPFDQQRVGWACFRVEQLFLSLCEVEFNLHAQHPLYFSVLTELLTQIRDLMEVAKKELGFSLAWSDDISPCRYYEDVSGLIKFFRDGFCHSHSYHSKIAPDYGDEVSKAIVPGKHKGTITFRPEIDMSNPYHDDVAIFLGANRILLRRHIGRAFEELRQKFVDEGIVGSPTWSKLLGQHVPRVHRSSTE